MIIHPLDNVEIRDDGHKYALRAIRAGENVIKYGMPIGHATCDIAPGEHVHVHNVATNLGDNLTYIYEPDSVVLEPPPRAAEIPTFKGYRHPDGRVGVRNDIWVVPTVGCVNNLCERLAASCGGIALTHPYGCSQLGADHEMTANLLAALCRHPNAGGVLVVALGCENNTLDSFKERLGDISTLNIRFLRAQDPGDEYARGLELIKELESNRPATRVDVPVSELVVGLKCGGSDGFSGLTANPLVGRFSDWLVARGGSTLLTEVPEMFGAETLLMRRCRDRAVFEKCVKMVNDFKDYYTRHGQPCYENPSPGNKAGGITTLEDKSLGCVQKGGSSRVEDVLDYGEHVKAHGLSLAVHDRTRHAVRHGGTHDEDLHEHGARAGEAALDRLGRDGEPGCGGVRREGAGGGLRRAGAQRGGECPRHRDLQGRRHALIPFQVLHLVHRGS